MSYNFKAKFAGDNEYLPSDSTVEYITPTLGTVTLSADVPVRVEQNETISMALYLKNKENQLTTKDTTAKITITPPSGSASVITTTIRNGSSTVNYTPTQEGVYTISMVTVANSYYNVSNTVSKTMRTGKIPTHLSFDVSDINPILGFPTTAQGTLLDVDNNPIPSKPVKISGTLCETSIITTNQQGNFSKSITKTVGGTYNVKASFDGDNDYQSSQSSTINVGVQKIDPSIEVINPTIYRGEYVFIALYDPLGYTSNVGNKPLTLTLTGGALSSPLTYTKNTDSNGIIDFQINLAAGSYTLAVSFAGDSALRSQSITSPITVRDYRNSPEKYASTAANYGTSQAPYKLWTDVDCANGSEVVCGSSSNLIAASGTYNTPQPILFTNFGFNLPANSRIVGAKVIWTDVTTNKGLFGTPTIQLVNTGYGDSTTVSAPSGASASSTLHEKAFSSVNISQSAANSSNFGVIFRYGKNTSGNPCLLKMSGVRMLLSYVAPQTRPTGV